MSKLVATWLDRLGSEHAAALDDDGLARFPELYGALVPTGLKLRCRSEDPHYLARIGSADLEISLLGAPMHPGHGEQHMEPLGCIRER